MTHLALGTQIMEGLVLEVCSCWERGIEGKRIDSGRKGGEETRRETRRDSANGSETHAEISSGSLVSAR